MRKRQHTIVLLRRRHLSMRSRTGCVCVCWSRSHSSNGGAVAGWRLACCCLAVGTWERQQGGMGTKRRRIPTNPEAASAVARKGGTLSTTAGVGTRATRIRTACTRGQTAGEWQKARVRVQFPTKLEKSTYSATFLLKSAARPVSSPAYS
jgi:hypothetical protein